jgi:uncharacterized phage-associated protein
MDSYASVQAFDYFANHCNSNGKISNIQALKLLFFAERYHVRKYGKFFSGDVFFAMKNGPVASNAYNILKSDDRIELKIKKYRDVKIENTDNNHYKTLKQFASRDDYDHLSDSALESLDFALENFGSMDRWRAVEITHNYPEWKRFKDTFEKNANVSKRINIDDFFVAPADENDPYNIIPMDVVEANRDWFKGDF